MYKSHRLSVKESMAMLTSQLAYEKSIRVRCKDLQTRGLMCPTEAVLHNALLIDVLLSNVLQCQPSCRSSLWLLLHTCNRGKKNEAPETIKAKEFSGAAGRNRPNLHDHHYGTR